MQQREPHGDRSPILRLLRLNRQALQQWETCRNGEYRVRITAGLVPRPCPTKMPLGFNASHMRIRRSWATVFIDGIHLLEDQHVFAMRYRGLNQHFLRDVQRL